MGLSDNSEALTKMATILAGEAAKRGSEGTAYKKVVPLVTTMVCSSADLLSDVAKSGGNLTSTNLTSFVLKRAIGFAELSDNDKVLCVAALTDLVASAAFDLPVLVAGTAADVGSAGATVAPSIPLMIASAANLSLAGIKSYQQCGPLVVKKIADLDDTAYQIYLQASVYIGNPAP